MAEPMIGRADGLAAILTVGEVASLLRLSTSATKRIPPASLPYTRVGDRGDRRYRTEDVEKYLAARRVES